MDVLMFQFHAAILGIYCYFCVIKYKTAWIIIEQ